MLMHTYNQRTGKAGVEHHYKFEDSLVYKADTKNKQRVQNCQVTWATGMEVVAARDDLTLDP